MKVFLINLAKNPERMAYVGGQLDKLGVAYERLDAVYGKDLSREEMRERVNDFRFWCACGSYPTPGEVGCALSHAQIYQRMVDEDIPYACILEDDVKIAPTFPRILQRVMAWVNPQDNQVILLSAHGALPRNEEIIEPIAGAMCTDGYVITRKAAQAILRANYPVVTVADAWSRWAKRGLIKMWRIYPTTIEQNNELCGSDINLGYRKAVDVISPYERLFHYVKRIIGVLIDRLYWWGARR